MRSEIPFSAELKLVSVCKGQEQKDTAAQKRESGKPEMLNLIQEADENATLSKLIP